MDAPPVRVQAFRNGTNHGEKAPEAFSLPQALQVRKRQAPTAVKVWVELLLSLFIGVPPGNNRGGGKASAPKAPGESIRTPDPGVNHIRAKSTPTG